MKKIVVIVSLVLCMLFLVVGSFIYHDVSFSSEEPNLYFYMTKSYLKWMKGRPTLSQTNDINGHLELYYEQDELYGYSAEKVYTFRRTFATWRLTEVTYTVYNVNAIGARNLFNQLDVANSELYSQRENYYHDAVIDNLETEGLLSTSLGTNDGATGTNVYIKYEEGVLFFTAIIQE